MNCKFCNKECKNKNSLAQHEIRCKLNPNRIDTSKNGNYHAWNKGLTKETDNRVNKYSNTLKVALIGKTTGKASSKEKEELRRHKISCSIKANPNAGGLRPNSGRGKKGHYKSFYCDSTYELVFIIYCLDHNIKFKRNTKGYKYIYNNETHLYYPDFELDDGSLIEIKGFNNKLVDIKASAVKDKKLVILYYSDIKYMFDYVKDHYTYKKLEDLYE